MGGAWPSQTPCDSKTQTHNHTNKQQRHARGGPSPAEVDGRNHQRWQRLGPEQSKRARHRDPALLEVDQEGLVRGERSWAQLVTRLYNQKATEKKGRDGGREQRRGRKKLNFPDDTRRLMMLTGAGVIATPLHITQLVAAVEDVLLGSMKDQPIEVSHQPGRPYLRSRKKKSDCELDGKNVQQLWQR